jgi:hypothetical protein
MVFRALDLPAFDRPANAISAPSSGGARSALGTLVRKTVWRKSMLMALFSHSFPGLFIDRPSTHWCTIGVFFAGWFADRAGICFHGNLEIEPG